MLAKVVAQLILYHPSLVCTFFDGQVYWLADGFHRFLAADMNGDTHLRCEIRPGDERDAILFSCGVNAEHGLRRTNADKRRQVEMLLRDAVWREWSDSEIMRHTLVHRDTIAKIRAEIYPPLSCGNPQDSAAPIDARLEPRMSRRGDSVYAMSTANLGHPARANDASEEITGEAIDTEPAPPQPLPEPSANGNVVNGNTNGLPASSGQAVGFSLSACELNELLRRGQLNFGWRFVCHAQFSFDVLVLSIGKPIDRICFLT